MASAREKRDDDPGVAVSGALSPERRPSYAPRRLAVFIFIQFASGSVALYLRCAFKISARRAGRAFSNGSFSIIDNDR